MTLAIRLCHDQTDRGAAVLRGSKTGGVHAVPVQIIPDPGPLRVFADSGNQERTHTQRRRVQRDIARVAAREGFDGNLRGIHFKKGRRHRSDKHIQTTYTQNNDFIHSCILLLFIQRIDMLN